MLPSDFYQSPQPSFLRPVPIPDAEPDDLPLMTVCFNRAWAAVLLGAALQLTQLATWDTDDPDAALLAQEQANQLVSMLAGDTASIPGGGSGSGGCMPEFRLTDTCGLEVNCGTTDAPDWQPVFTTQHPEGGAQIPYPPDTTQYEDDTARCITAANIAYQLKSGTSTLATDAAIVGGIAVAIIDLLGAFLFFVPGGVLVDIAIAIINIAVGHTADDFSAAYPDIDWEHVRDGLSCFMNRDGSISESGRAAFLDWMSGQYAGNLAWELTKIIVQNVTADGLTIDARAPQNDIPVDGCPLCGSGCLVTFDEGGMPYTFGTVGYLETGTGIDGSDNGRGQVTVISGSEYSEVYVKIPLAAGTLDGITLWYQIIFPVGSSGFTGISAVLYDADDGVVSASNHPGVSDTTDWTEFTVFSGAGLTVLEGYYLIVDVGVGWGIYSGYAADTVTRIDNIQVSGDSIC